MNKDCNILINQEQNVELTTTETTNKQNFSLDFKKSLPWVIFVVFLGVLNETVFNVATPSIATQFGLQPSGASLVITSFMIFFGVGSVIYGKMSDTYRLKPLIIIGLLIYCGGSLFGFLAHENYSLVIAARIIQGAGCSAISALMMVIIARYISPENRGKAFGILGSTVAFSEGIGPAIGGFVSANYHWAFLFLIPLFTLLSIPFFYKVLPDEMPGNGKVDFLGAALLVIGVASLILYITEPRWPFIVIGVALLGWFAVHIRQSEQPFIEPAMFVKRKYIIGVLSGFVLFCTGMGILFMTPLMLSHVHQLSTDVIGWILFPGSMSVIAFGAAGGSLADKRGNPFVLLLGLFLLIISVLTISLLVEKSQWLISAALLPTFIGLSFIKTAVSNSVTQTLEMDEIGVGMGLYGLASFLSEAVGTALVGKALDKRILDFSLLPTVTEPSAYMYSNMFLVFVFFILFGGAVYMSVFRRG